MRRYFFLIAVLMITVEPHDVTADVVIKSKATVGPMLGIGTSESDVTTYIKGDRNRTETSTSFKSTLFQGMTPEDNTSLTTEIFRLDKEVKWNLESRNKSYREIFLKSLKPVTGEYGNQGSSGEDFSPTGQADDYNWAVQMNISDDSENVNGFESRKAIVNATGVDKEDNSDSMFVVLKMWKSEELPNLNEIKEYYRKFSEMTGFDENSGSDKIEAYSSGFGDEFEESARRIEEMKGFTVKTELTVQKSSGSDNSESGGMNMSDLMKGMMDRGEEGGESGNPENRVTLISITDEIISIDDSDVNDGLFEIPEGYSKIE